MKKQVECLYDIWDTGRMCSHPECLGFRGYDGKVSEGKPK